MAGTSAEGRPGRFWSLGLSGNWRLIVRFEGGDASDLDLVDYH
jgi:toxin HigB-1